MVNKTGSDAQGWEYGIEPMNITVNQGHNNRNADM